jgi:hypothetical protein
VLSSSGSSIVFLSSNLWLSSDFVGMLDTVNEYDAFFRNTGNYLPVDKT